MHMSLKHKEARAMERMAKQPPKQYVCELTIEVGDGAESVCGCTFGSAKGLQTHIGLRHKAIANEKKLADYKSKSRHLWSDQEQKYLVTLEASFRHNADVTGKKLVVGELIKFFQSHPAYSNRTTDALEKRRLIKGHKDNVLREVQSLSALHGNVEIPMTFVPVEKAEAQAKAPPQERGAVGASRGVTTVHEPDTESPEGGVHLSVNLTGPSPKDFPIESELDTPTPGQVEAIATQPQPQFEVVNVSSDDDSFVSCGEQSPGPGVKIKEEPHDFSFRVCSGRESTSTPIKIVGRSERECRDESLLLTERVFERVVAEETDRSLEFFEANDRSNSVNDNGQEDRPDPLVVDRMDMFRSFFSSRRSMLGGLWRAEAPCGINTDPAAIDAWVHTILEGKSVSKPKVTHRNYRNENPPLETLSRKGLKKLRRKRTQELWQKSPSSCIKAVLNDQVISHNSVNSEEMVEYWSEVFSRTNTAGMVHLEGEAAPYRSDLDLPFTEGEISRVYSTLNDSSPGFDGVTRKTLREIGKTALWVMCNVFLVAEYTPTFMRKGRVVLIPKVKNPTNPGDLRPLTMMSKVVRFHHKLIGERLEKLPMSDRQKGFKKRDGMCELLYTLDALIRDARDNRRAIHILFLDVAKAFDTVSHQGLIQVLAKKGTPNGLLGYLRKTYSQMEVVLPGQAEPLLKRQGVMQGDPKSGTEFNHVVDEVYAPLDPAFGYRITLPAAAGEGEESVSITDSEFADDGWLVSSTKVGLMAQAEKVVAGFKKFGMKLNASKCAVLSLVYDGKKKTHVVLTDPYLSIDGSLVPMIGPNDTYKYLGLRVGPFGFNTADFMSKFRTSLDRLSTSALNPQQKLYGLKTCLVPSLFHTLVLANVSNRALADMDKRVRRAVRAWLHSPADVPNAAFHAGVNDGGLGIPNICARTRRLGSKRLTDMRLKGDCRVVKFLLGDRGRSDLFNKLSQVHKIGTHVVCSKESEAEAWRQELHATVDGKDLSLRGLPSAVVAGASKRHCRSSPLDLWLKDERMKVRGGEFVKAIGVRLKSLKTPSRGARGGRGDARCRHDLQIGDLNHIVQHCACVHGLRVQRHNTFVKGLCKSLRNRGYQVHPEPVIPTSLGDRKPDLVAVKGRCAHVLDPIISVENPQLEKRESEKSEKYSVEEVVAYARGLVREQSVSGGPIEVKVHGLALSYRGFMRPETVKVLRDLGVPKRAMAYWTLRVLVDSWFMWKAHSNSASRARARRIS